MKNIKNKSDQSGYNTVTRKKLIECKFIRISNEQPNQRASYLD